MAAKKKESKEVQAASVFLTQDFWDKFLRRNDVNQSASVVDLKRYKWKNEEYDPFYTVRPFGSSAFNSGDFTTARDIRKAKAEDRERVTARFLNFGTVANEPIVKVTEKLLEKQQYFPVSFIQRKDLVKPELSGRNPTTVRQIRDYLVSQYNLYVHAPIVAQPVYPMYSRDTPKGNVVDFTKTTTVWQKHIYYSGSPRRSNVCITNFFFLADIPTAYISFTLDMSEIIPMYTMMIKKGYTKYVRACIASNKVINPEVLEFWYDKKMEGEHSLSDSFKKLILTPIQSSGVEIKVFDSLADQIYEVKRDKVFKSIKEQKDWAEQEGSDFIIAERKKYGIVPENEIDEFVGMLMKGEDKVLEQTLQNSPF